MRTAVLVSGNGTNLQALLDAQARAELAPAQILLVISNRPNVRALQRAQEAGVAHQVIDHTCFAGRREFEEALLTALAENGIEALVLAGFMRILGADFVANFPHKIINTHPALCPAFPGLNAAQQAITAGVKISGCTVHLVDAGVDTGPILFQEPVVVQADDDAHTLQQRIQVLEHRLLPKAVQYLAAGRFLVSGSKVQVQ